MGWDDGRIRRRESPKKKRPEGETAMVDGRPARASDREKRVSGRNWRSFSYGEEDGEE
jgi:hypothetical protein